MAGWQCYMSDEWLAQGRGTPPPPGYYDARKQDPPEGYDPDHPPLTIVGSSTPRPAPAPAPTASALDVRIAQAHKTIQQVGENFEDHRQAIEAQRGVLRPEAMRPLVEGYVDQPEVKAALDGAVQQVADVLSEAQAEEKVIRAALIPPRDMAGQVEAQRTWARQKEYLDSSADGSERIARAREIIRGTPDLATFQTAVEEIIPNLRTNGLPTAWAEEEIAQRVPALAQARQKVADAEKQLTTTRFNAAEQKRALARGATFGHLVDPNK